MDKTIFHHPTNTTRSINRRISNASRHSIDPEVLLKSRSEEEMFHSRERERERENSMNILFLSLCITSSTAFRYGHRESRVSNFSGNIFMSPFSLNQSCYQHVQMRYLEHEQVPTVPPYGSSPGMMLIRLSLCT